MKKRNKRKGLSKRSRRVVRYLAQYVTLCCLLNVSLNSWNVLACNGKHCFVLACGKLAFAV